MLVVIGELNDGVARADLADGLVLPEEPFAFEDVVDLLRAPVRVRRSRQPPRLDTDAVQPEPGASGGVAEPPPGGRHRSLVTPDPFNLVPVHDHGARR